MEIFSMLGLSAEDVEKIQAVANSLVELPAKVDALTAKIEELEQRMTNGKSE